MKRSFLLLTAALLIAGCDKSAPTTKGPGAPTGGTPAAGSSTPSGTALAAATVDAGKVKLSEANTRVTFVGRKPEGKHDGGFDKISGEIAVGDKGVPTSINVEFDTNSITSDDPKLTNHLKQDDFFQAAQHPKITFSSTKIEPTADGATVTGDLTLRGNKKSISFPVKSKVDGSKLSLSGEFKINRKDFGMTYGGGKILDEVDVKVVVGN